MKKFVLSLSLIFSLSACDMPQAKKEESLEVHAKATEPVEERQEKIPLKLEVVPGDYMGEYNVFLSWQKEAYFKKGFIKKRLIQEKNSSSLEALEAKEFFWIDKRIQEGQKIQYQLWGITFAEERKLLASQEVHIPTDILIEGNQNISQWQNLLKSGRPIGRLVFLSNATLQIEDKDFKLKVQKLHADEGHIISFPLGKKSPIGKKGRNGGAVEIHAEKAEGNS